MPPVVSVLGSWVEVVAGQGMFAIGSVKSGAGHHCRVSMQDLIRCSCVINVRLGSGLH
jgi:hypothetical protein